MVLAALTLDELRRFRPLDAPERVLHARALAQAEAVYAQSRRLALYLGWLNAYISGDEWELGAR